MTLPWKCPPLLGQKYIFICRCIAFCMTKRLFPASGSKVLEDKQKMESPTFSKMAFIHQREEILTSKPIFTQGVSYGKITKNGEHKSPPEHTFIWRLV